MAFNSFSCWGVNQHGNPSTPPAPHPTHPGTSPCVVSGNPGDAQLLGLVPTIHHGVTWREGQLLQGHLVHVPPTVHVATLDASSVVPPVVHLAIVGDVNHVVLGPVLVTAKPESREHVGPA